MLHLPRRRPLDGVWAVVHPHRRSLAAGAALATASPVLALAEPWPLALAVDHAIDHRPFTGVLADVPLPSPGWLLAGCAGAALLLAGVAGWLDYRMVLRTERTAEQIGAALRQTVFDRAMTLSSRFHDRTSSGEVVSRLTTDVGRILDALVAVTMVVLADGITVVGALVVLAVVDPWLALVALVAVPALGFVAARQRRRVRDVQRVARHEAGRLAAVATELLRHVRAVQSLSRRRSVERRFDRVNAAALDAQRAAVRVEAGWTPRADLVLAAGTTLALVVGVERVLGGALTTGALVLVLAYIRELYRPIRSLARLAGTFAKAGASAERIAEVLASPEVVPERADPLPVPVLRDGVRLERVRFGHDPERPVLDAVDLHLAAGATTALVGASGIGKTTLLHLVLRLRDVDAGTVRLDDTDVRDVALAELREHIAYVPQDAWLIDGTVAENIALGRVGVTRAEIAVAAHAVGLDVDAPTRDASARDASARDASARDATGRPGLDGPVGEGGELLSGGQRRRVAIARAIVSRAPLLLVDEPSAGLDALAVTEVLGALRAAAHGRTTVVVTHDPVVMEIADHVVELPAPHSRPDPDEEVNHDQEHRDDLRSAVPPRAWADPHQDADPQPRLIPQGAGGPPGPPAS